MTFREKPITKLYAFAMAAVFALVLAGCGGGGGSATAPDPEPPTMPEPTPQEMCEGDGGRYNADGSCTSAEELAAEMAEAEALSGAQEAAMAAYMAAMAAVSGAKDPVAMANAQPHATAAMAASASAAAATTSAMAEEYKAAAEAARDMAMDAAGMRGLGLTTLANKITNQSAIDNAVLENKPPVKPVSNAKRVGAALAASAGAEAAIAATPAVTEVTATPTTPGVASAAAVANGSVSQGQTVVEAPTTPTALSASARASHSASGPILSATMDTTNSIDAVTRGETPMPLTTRGGWMGAELAGKSPAAGAVTSMTYANVYTDIQPTEMVTEYSATGTTIALPTTAGVTAGVTGDIPADGSDFTGTYNANIADNTPPVAGMFDCPTPVPAGGCSISVNEDGELVAIQGYQFRRATGTTTKADADYLAWGVWLRVPTATAATDVAATGAFASGSDVFIVTQELKGTATYNGVAAGLYSAGGMVEYFDADVSLTANFGGNVGADSTPGSAPAATDNDGFLIGAVTGSVSNIKAGGMDVEGSLTLKRATVTRTTDGGAAFLTATTGLLDPASTNHSTTGFTGDASGTLAGRAMSGNWGGQFYGPNKAKTAKALETEFPTTAAGTFGASAAADANNPDPISLLGSFGAWKAE